MQVPCQLYKKIIFNEKNAENQLKTGRNVKFPLFFTEKIRVLFFPCPDFHQRVKIPCKTESFLHRYKLKSVIH